MKTHLPFDIRFVKFLLVGALNTAFGYGIFALFIYSGMHYSIAVLLSSICGILFNFKTTGSLVFQTTNNTLVFRFLGVYGVIYLLNIIGLELFSLCRINNYLGGALLLLPMAVVAFLLQKKFVFIAQCASKNLVIQ